MVIAKNNTRAHITLPKQLKKDLEELAQKQNRSLNNLITTRLKEYVDDEKQKGHL